MLMRESGRRAVYQAHFRENAPVLRELLDQTLDPQSCRRDHRNGRLNGLRMPTSYVFLLWLSCWLCVSGSLPSSARVIVSAVSRVALSCCAPSPPGLCL